MTFLREIFASDSTIQTKAAPQNIWTTIGQVAALAVSITITVVIFLLRHRISELAVYGYGGIMLTTTLSNATVFVPAPSLAVLFAVEGGLNPIWVGVAAGLGATMGEMTGFLAGVGGRGVIQNRPIYYWVQDWMKVYGLFVIFVMALIPNPIFDIGGIIAGAMRIPAWRFFLACLTGKGLRFVILAYLGLLIFA